MPIDHPVNQDRHYVLVRPDLPFGLLAAQCVHAAGESAVFRAPPEHCHAVVLSAEEPELLRLEKLLKEKGFQISAVYENVAPWDGKIMAIGIAPCSEGVSRWLRHLPLLRSKQSV